MNLCDSIYLLYDGNLKSTLRNGSDINSEQILTLSREENNHVRFTQPGAEDLDHRQAEQQSFITLFMVGVLVIVFGLACLIVPNFYLPQNILNLATNNWFLIVIGIGVTFLLITGNFDMSVGGNIALTGVLSVYSARRQTDP